MLDQLMHAAQSRRIALLREMGLHREFASKGADSRSRRMRCLIAKELEQA